MDNSLLYHCRDKYHRLRMLHSWYVYKFFFGWALPFARGPDPAQSMGVCTLELSVLSV